MRLTGGRNLPMTILILIVQQYYSDLTDRLWRFSVYRPCCQHKNLQKIIIGIQTLILHIFNALAASQLNDVTVYNIGKNTCTFQ